MLRSNFSTPYAIRARRRARRAVILEAGFAVALIAGVVAFGLIYRGTL